MISHTLFSYMQLLFLHKFNFSKFEVYRSSFVVAFPPFFAAFAIQTAQTKTGLAHSTRSALPPASPFLFLHLRVVQRLFQSIDYVRVKRFVAESGNDFESSLLAFAVRVLAAAVPFNK